jgi:hypothetical protein
MSMAGPFTGGVFSMALDISTEENGSLWQRHKNLFRRGNGSD